MRWPGVRVPSPALRLLERRAEVGPDRVDVLDADRQAEEPDRDAVALPAVAALHRRAHAAERRLVPDQPGRGLDGALRAVGDVERDQPAEAGVAHLQDGGMLG